MLFMVDQLAAKWLDLARAGIVELPNFDALQAEAATFDLAFSTNPVCTPSRASIATGLSSAANAVGECGYALDPSVPTFMHGLQKTGWRTGAFGKLHFIPQIQTLTPDYHPYGFDVVCNTEDSRAGEWLDWVKNTHPEHYQAAQSTVWMTMVPDLENYGPDHADLRSEILAAQKRFPESTGEAYELPYPAEVSQTAWITDRACDFIQGADGDIFAQISYVQPHNPFSPPAEYVDLVNSEAIPDPAAAEWKSAPIPYYEQARYAQASYDTCDWRRDRTLYFADLAHLDHELGRVRDALAGTGRLDDCLFVFTSDHGELLHDHGLLGKWERHYDPCIRIPLIIQAPGTTPGRYTELAEHSDIAATIYDWTGTPTPELPVWNRTADAPMSMLHGRSLLPTITCSAEQPERPERTHVFIQSNNSHVEASPRSWARTIRTPRYRYTRHLAGGGEQLFDLIHDPDEQDNLAYDERYRDLRETMLAELAEATARDAFPNSPLQLFKIGSW